MRFRPPLQAVNSISQKGSLVWSGFMFVHDGKTTLTLFRDLRLFWSTFNKNMCISTFFCPFYPYPHLRGKSCHHFFFFGLLLQFQSHHKSPEKKMLSIEKSVKSLLLTKNICYFLPLLANVCRQDAKQLQLKCLYLFPQRLA